MRSVDAELDVGLRTPFAMFAASLRSGIGQLRDLAGLTGRPVSGTVHRLSKCHFVGISYRKRKKNYEFQCK
jgi:hypothetical protein